jgi:DNA-binding beta-propeller fold protein YncE/cytochrome c553
MVLSAGCSLSTTQGGSPPSGPGSDPTQPTPPTNPDPPPVTAATYVRGSLSPKYLLTQRTEYQKFTEQGVTLQDADFQAAGNSFTSASQKMDQIAAQIAADTGKPVVDLLAGDDRLRPNLIPFRGHPGDVKILSSKGQRLAFVPLGGDVMKPGNEVAIVDLVSQTFKQRLQVGIRPMRVAIHPAGLVFVANELSNYISIIDPSIPDLLRDKDGKPVEIKSDFYNEDMVFLPQSIQGADPDKQDLFVANAWHGSILKYSLAVQRDGTNNITNVVVTSTPAAGAPANTPTAEIGGVGRNPFRITIGQDQQTLFVANFRGGQIARVNPVTGSVATVTINAPVPQIIQANDVIIGLTTMIDRGLPARQDPTPEQIQAAPVMMAGLDGQQHQAHPGGMVDTTSEYNFEDLRNGMFTLNANLTNSNLQYFTDDISPEKSFQPQQKVLAGSLPQAIVLNNARNQAFVAMSGSDQIQKFSIVGGQFRLQKGTGANALISTQPRPFELALDETNNQLLSANWGGETLQIFNATSGALQKSIDLGYAALATNAYPTTNIERGEYFFYNTKWSNNGRKSCGTCHWQELLLDGVPFANGATGPNEYHKVTANWNLLTTDPYFWNASFSNGTYASLASDAQSRSNCELIAFGQVEGMTSDPTTRIGDPNDRMSSANDTMCRPVFSKNTILPDNFSAIAAVIAQDKLVRDTVVQGATGFVFKDVSRFVDQYSVGELRLPANPNAYVLANNLLDSASAAKVAAGKTVFTNAGCGGCHDPNNQRHPFTDGQNHGQGTQWTSQFIQQYGADPRLLAIIPGGIPSGMTIANATSLPSTPGPEINVHVDPIDYFEPFCFTIDHCLQFLDPLAVRSANSVNDPNSAETLRLQALVLINLANADRGFIPGNIPDHPLANTPSLRGIWYQTNYLRHGLAHSFREAVLAPGHPALKAGENGFAVDRTGKFDVHGATSKLTADDMDNLAQYLFSID